VDKFVDNLGITVDNLGITVDNLGISPYADISYRFSHSEKQARYPHIHIRQACSSFDFERWIGYTVVHMRLKGQEPHAERRGYSSN
jgi:hypothetical protein